MAIVARRPDVLEETKSEIESASDGKVFAYPCGISDSGQVADRNTEANANWSADRWMNEFRERVSLPEPVL